MLVLEGTSGVNALCFTSDRTQLLVARDDGAVDVWTLVSGGRVELFAPLNKRQYLQAVALHPTGAVRVTSGDQPEAISVSEPSTRTMSGIGGVQQLIISPRADWVIVARWGGIAGCRCGPDLRFDGEPVWEAQHHVSRESPCAFLGSNGCFVTNDRDLLVVRKVSTGELLTTVVFPYRESRTLTASADGKWFAVMGYQKLLIWDTATWNSPLQVSGLNRWVNSMAFHPTKPILLATQNLQSLVKYLDADTGKVIRKFNWKLGPLQSVAFSSDGTLAAAGSLRGKIVVWDVDE